jgi:hypothetical protein
MPTLRAPHDQSPSPDPLTPTHSRGAPPRPPNHGESLAHPTRTAHQRATPVERVNGRYCGPRPARPSRRGQWTTPTRIPRSDRRLPLSTSATPLPTRTTAFESRISCELKIPNRNGCGDSRRQPKSGTRPQRKLTSTTTTAPTTVPKGGRSHHACRDERGDRPRPHDPRCPTGPRRTAASQTCGSTSIPGAGSSRPRQQQSSPDAPPSRRLVT